MTDRNFIQQFDEKIQQLNTLNNNINKNIAMRQSFTQDLKERLRYISKNITTLYGLISELKQNRDNLETNLNDNKSNIQNNTDEINKCKETINSLNREKTLMEERLEEQNQAITKKIHEKQNIVEDNEAKLIKLTQANEKQQSELSALKNERTEKQQQHAEALERLNEQHTKHLDDQRSQFSARISNLENQIADLNQQLSSNNEQLTNSQKSLQEQINEKQTQINQLTIANQTLQEENNALQQKIHDATEAIGTAIAGLTNLMNKVPNQDSEREIIEILNTITHQIEGSITIINNINNNNNNTQGQAPAPAPAQGSQDAVIIRDYPQRLSDEQLTTNNIDNVLGNLQQYSDVVSTEEKNKIQNTIRVLQNSKNQITDEQIKKIYKQAFQKGGKRTRKMRNKKMRKTRKIKKSKKHQKGGFIYNPNTKRKKLKSSKNATRSRSSTRKRTYSSKTSRQRSKSSKSSF